MSNEKNTLAGSASSSPRESPLPASPREEDPRPECVCGRPPPGVPHAFACPVRTPGDDLSDALFNIDCGVTMEGRELIEQALARARSEGRAAGIEEAALLCEVIANSPGDQYGRASFLKTAEHLRALSGREGGRP